MSSLVMPRSVVSLAMSVALLGSVTFGFTPAASASQFQDIQGNWAKQAIEQLNQKNIIGGYPDGSFKPNDSITRAEFSAVLVKSLGLNTMPVTQSAFSDVPSNYWAAPAIQAVKSAGVINGYPDGSFGPMRPITRAEAIAVVVNAARVPMPTEAEADRILAAYGDTAVVPAWAKRSMAAAVQSGLYANDPMSVYRLTPLNPATRADVSAMLYKQWQMANQPMTSPMANNSDMSQGQTMSAATGMPSQNQIQARVVTIPAQTNFAATLQSPISSELNRVGDTLQLTLDAPILSPDGMTVIPSQSQIAGRITNMTPVGKLGKNATVELSFYEVISPSGERYPITGRVNAENGLLMGGSTKGRVGEALLKTAVGAGLGAALGTAMGPLSGGKVGRGAVYGTAVGAGAGAVAAAASDGNPVVLKTGDKLSIQLSQPLTVSMPAGALPNVSAAPGY
jgi:hypothetical protein